jgi:hypothetical protein
MDGSGAATAAWARSNGSHFIVQASRYSGGVWSAPVDLSVAGQSGFSTQLVVDGANVVTAAWQRSDGSFSIIQASRFTPVVAATAVPTLTEWAMILLTLALATGGALVVARRRSSVQSLIG